jgi:hypothetical protein
MGREQRRKGGHKKGAAFRKAEAKRRRLSTVSKDHPERQLPCRDVTVVGQSRNSS